MLNKSILGIDTVWEMEDNIIRKKKQGNIMQGENLFHAKKLKACIKFSAHSNWGLAEQTPLEVGAFSSGSAFGLGSLPLSLLPPAYLNKYFHPLTHSLAFFFSPSTLVFLLLFSSQTLHCVLQLVAFPWLSFFSHHFPPWRFVSTHSSGGAVLS